MLRTSECEQTCRGDINKSRSNPKCMAFTPHCYVNVQKYKGSEECSHLLKIMLFLYGRTDTKNLVF